MMHSSVTIITTWWRNNREVVYVIGGLAAVLAIAYTLGAVIH